MSTETPTIEETFAREFRLFQHGLPKGEERAKLHPGIAVIVAGDPKAVCYGMEGIIIEIKRRPEPYVRLRIKDDLHSGTFTMKLGPDEVLPVINLTDEQLGIFAFYGDESRAYMENSARVHQRKRTQEKNQILAQWAAAEEVWKDIRLNNRVVQIGDVATDTVFEISATGYNNYRVAVTLRIEHGMSLVAPRISWGSYSQSGAVTSGPQFALLQSELIVRAADLAQRIMRARYPGSQATFDAAVAE